MNLTLITKFINLYVEKLCQINNGCVYFYRNKKRFCQYPVISEELPYCKLHSINPTLSKKKIMQLSEEQYCNPPRQIFVIEKNDNSSLDVNIANESPLATIPNGIKFYYQQQPEKEFIL